MSNEFVPSQSISVMSDANTELCIASDQATS